ALESSHHHGLLPIYDVVPRKVMNARPAPPIALMAMPVSSRVTISVRPPVRLMRYTASTAMSPPRNAKAGVVHAPNVASPKVRLRSEEHTSELQSREN